MNKYTKVPSLLFGTLLVLLVLMNDSVMNFVSLPCGAMPTRMTTLTSCTLLKANGCVYLHIKCPYISPYFHLRLDVLKELNHNLEYLEYHKKSDACQRNHETKNIAYNEIERSGRVHSIEYGDGHRGSYNNLNSSGRMLGEHD